MTHKTTAEKQKSPEISGNYSGSKPLERNTTPADKTDKSNKGICIRLEMSRRSWHIEDQQIARTEAAN